MTRTLLLIASLLAGCATSPMDRAMLSWEGENIDAVVKQWGKWDAERELLVGKIYIWNTPGDSIVPSPDVTTATSMSTSPGIKGGLLNTVAMFCERALTVDEGGKVISGTWQGDSCCIATIAGECGRWPNPARRP